MGREGRVHLGCLGAQEFIWDGFLLALVKLYMYIPSSGLKGTLTIIRESWPKKGKVFMSHYNIGSTSDACIQEKCGLDSREDFREQSQWHLSKDPNT